MQTSRFFDRNPNVTKHEHFYWNISHRYSNLYLSTVVI